MLRPIWPALPRRRMGERISEFGQPPRKWAAFPLSDVFLGSRWAKELAKAASAHKISGMVRRGLSNPAAGEVARRFRAGPYEVRGAVGGEVDVYSASWRTCIGRKGPAKGASRTGRDGTITQPKACLVLNPEDLLGTRWGSANSVLQNAEHRRLTSKLRLAATAEDPVAPDLCRRELAIAPPNSQNAFEIADVMAGGLAASTRAGRAPPEASRAVRSGQGEGAE